MIALTRSSAGSLYINHWRLLAATCMSFSRSTRPATAITSERPGAYFDLIPSIISRSASSAHTASMSKQEQHELYMELLRSRGRGHPLWHPGPNLQLSQDYRDCGVSIGDLAVLCDDGTFDFLYNFANARDHPFNIGQWHSEVIPEDGSLSLENLSIMTQISKGEEHISEYVGIERSFGEPASGSSDHENAQVVAS